LWGASLLFFFPFPPMSDPHPAFDVFPTSIPIYSTSQFTAPIFFMDDTCSSPLRLQDPVFPRGRCLKSFSPPRICPRAHLVCTPTPQRPFPSQFSHSLLVPLFILVVPIPLTTLPKRDCFISYSPVCTCHQFPDMPIHPFSKCLPFLC